MSPELVPIVEAVRKTRVRACLIRSQSIRLQIEMGFTLCGVAEDRLCDGRADTARTVLYRLSGMTEKIRRHISEHHLSAQSAAELRIRLELLQHQVASLKEHLPAGS